MDDYGRFESDIRRNSMELLVNDVIEKAIEIRAKNMNLDAQL